MPFDEDGEYYTDRIDTPTEAQDRFTTGLLVQKIQKKRLELMEQLIEHAYDPNGNKLSDNDLIRYSAMVEVLKAVLQ